MGDWKYSCVVQCFLSMWHALGLSQKSTTKTILEKAVSLWDGIFLSSCPQEPSVYCHGPLKDSCGTQLLAGPVVVEVCDHLWPSCPALQWFWMPPAEVNSS